LLFWNSVPSNRFQNAVPPEKKPWLEVCAIGKEALFLTGSS
jgi:hypothetical protein